jgi:deazaflavin-dependent oxidoreductase (nitroreductase family)
MTKATMDEYLNNDATKKDELANLPDQVSRELQAHLEQYRTDPEKAHIWDPIVIGVTHGPVKCLLLDYIGRKSGSTRQIVIQYFEKDGKYAIVASRGGTVDHPEWYKNLLANPKCRIQVGTRGHDAVARTLDVDERARWWPLITREQPEQLKYESRTSRLIPVVVFDLA